jgi:transcriptional regulator with XRE-family HTH domain
LGKVLRQQHRSPLSLLLEARMHLGPRLRHLRQAQHLTQFALARRAHLSAQYVLLLEHDRRNPTVKTLRALAQALGVTVPALLEDEPPGAQV